MKVVCFVLCCVLAAQATMVRSEAKKEWEEFVATYKKTYKGEIEKEFRYKIFKENLQQITRHNEDFRAGKTTFSKGINKFADMLPSEILGEKNLKNKAMCGIVSNRSEKRSIPDSIDWREKGAVTPVIDQGGSGSAIVFAEVGAVESAHFIASGELVVLSKQELMDCCEDFSSSGCGGGFKDDAFKCIIALGGIDTEAAYHNSCQFEPADIGATISGYVDLPEGDERVLQETVATFGPTAVAINANSFFMYSGGILKDPNCDPSYLNHEVLVVGYGSEDGQDYWLLKNSWGTSWGEMGYIRIARNENNMCGVASAASYPVV